jgi:uncharacterized membrane protein
MGLNHPTKERDKMVAFYIVTLLLIPAIMIVIGLVWKNHPPKKINPFAGYRTTRSMKSQEAWDFAHRYFANICFYCGILLALATGVLLAAVSNLNLETLSWVVLWVTGIQVVALFLPIIPTEIELKKRFGDSKK